MAKKFSMRSAAPAIACFVLAGAFSLRPAAAQESGPLPASSPQWEPAPRPETRPAEPAPAPTPQAPGAQHHSSDISKDPPSIPTDQIIQQFAEREAEFKQERENFTYTQTFVIQTIDDGGQPDGEYRLTSDVTFTPTGKRYDVVTYAPPPTLERITLSEQDLDDLRNIQPFVLTTEELPKYDVTYVGREQVDELGTYVFDVAPKRIEKNQRYFQGRVWVDDKDLEIVKTFGKAVPDIRKGNSENVFPRFETYRENIEGHFWFPTYTHSDDVLNFKSGGIHIRMTVHYSDYKRFRSSGRVVPGTATPTTDAPKIKAPDSNP
ncbi:MAG TPA: hypothetical protein VEI55_00995 [Candidatus Acidoferrum sp.]|nr:hypothetical protein [Candidatus Acidoferrum sp.]